MQKLYYSISEISKIIDEEPHILRYWEKEFPYLKPKKNRGGNRTYSSRDLGIIRIIKKFLREDKLSLRGAKEHLEKLLNSENFDSLLEENSNELNFPEVNSKLFHNTDGEGKNINISLKDAIELHTILSEALNFIKS
jgi:DNA-binding transcriptional MerR regulator